MYKTSDQVGVLRLRRQDPEHLKVGDEVLVLVDGGEFECKNVLYVTHSYYDGWTISFQGWGECSADHVFVLEDA